MTLIAAIHHKRGIVLASDRRMVDLNSKSAYSEAQKLFQLNHNSGIAVYGGIPNYKGSPIPSEEVAKCLLDYKATNEDFSIALKRLQETLNEVLKPILDMKFDRFKQSLSDGKYAGVREINDISLEISPEGIVKYLVQYTTDSGKKETLEKPLETINIFGLSFDPTTPNIFRLGKFSLPGNYFSVNTLENHDFFTGVKFKGSDEAVSLVNSVLLPVPSSDFRVNHCRSLFPDENNPADKTFWMLQRELDDYAPMLSNLISAVSRTESYYPPPSGVSTVGEKTISAKISDKGFEWIERFTS